MSCHQCRRQKGACGVGVGLGASSIWSGQPKVPSPSSLRPVCASPSK